MVFTAVGPPLIAFLWLARWFVLLFVVIAAVLAAWYLMSLALARMVAAIICSVMR